MKTVISLIFLAIASLAVAQTPSASFTPAKKVIRISTPKMVASTGDSNVVLLEMDFNGAIPKSKLSHIKVKDVATISLVYTQFRLSDRFNQLELNAQRTNQLYNLMPGLRNNKSIQWYWVEQTGCHNPDECGEYFHGFVITLKSEVETFRREAEMALLDYYSGMYEGVSDPSKIDSLIATGKLSLIKNCDTVTVKNMKRGNRMAKISGWDERKRSRLARYLRKEMGGDGEYSLSLVMTPKGKLEFADPEIELTKSVAILKLLNENLRKTPARYKNKSIKSEVILQLTVNKNKVVVHSIQKPILPAGEVFSLDTFFYTEKKELRCEYLDTTGKVVYTPGSSSFAPDVVFRVFDRNKQWKNCLIATDVTGSMYPYLAQFRTWHKLNMTAASGNHDFVFFNDGDFTPDHAKVTGKVGGIYYVNTFNFDELCKTMTESMRNGGGGDCPENNIEAVIEGLKKNPACKEVVMIADNWATPRDLKLLDKVNVPIRLILCGAQYGINTAYLEMIRKNKGSIHTMEKDLYNLATLLDGQTINLDGYEYKLSGGKFILLSKSSASF